MPAKPETSLYNRLKENLSNCLITRIESRVNLGIPDCFIALKRHNRVAPVELKVVKHGRRVRLSPHQIAFHHRHAEANCSTFILVLYVPFGKSAGKEGQLLLYHGSQVLELARSGVDTAPLAHWHYGTMPWSMLELELANA
jgi:hypothetical protein